jgi:hypothetical protein
MKNTYDNFLSLKLNKFPYILIQPNKLLNDELCMIRLYIFNKNMSFEIENQNNVIMNLNCVTISDIPNYYYEEYILFF